MALNTSTGSGPLICRFIGKQVPRRCGVGNPTLSQEIRAAPGTTEKRLTTDFT